MRGGLPGLRNWEKTHIKVVENKLFSQKMSTDMFEKTCKSQKSDLFFNPVQLSTIMSFFRSKKTVRYFFISLANNENE